METHGLKGNTKGTRTELSNRGSDFLPVAPTAPTLSLLIACVCNYALFTRHSLQLWKTLM